jgi:hypothetical protein
MPGGLGRTCRRDAARGLAEGPIEMMMIPGGTRGAWNSIAWNAFIWGAITARYQGIGHILAPWS